MTFLYFLPQGLSNPAEPTWGSWAGAPKVTEQQTLHLLVMMRDDGTPALTGYQRIVFSVTP